MTRVTVILVGVALLLAAPAGASPANATRWGKIGPFAVGMSAQAVTYKHGNGTANHLGRVYLVDGGAVNVSFSHGVVQSVSCGPKPGCPRGFRLPDHTTPGEAIPYGKTWHGYALCANLGSYQGYNSWVKNVRDPGGRLLQINVGVYHGKVTSILEWRHTGCGA